MSDALVEAEGLLTELPDAVARRKLGERLSKAVHSLRTAERQISRVRALIELSHLIGFGKTAEQRADLEEMIGTAEDVGSALEKAQDEEQLRSAVDEYENSLPKALLTVERALRERWRFVAHDRFQPLIGIGGLLTSMNVPNDLGKRLAECGQKGLAAANNSDLFEMLVTVRTLLSELTALQQERAAEIGDDEVGEFVNALAEKKATLSMVTAKVLDWLDKHDALDRLWVNPR
jgi:hypothetical protein